VKAVLLAGGRGTRLRPFTTNFPKPLVPVGDVPILEILLRQLRSAGVDDATLLTGHLAYLLESYFADGAALRMRIDYLRESEPLGTAGPLRALAGKIDDDFFVMNGDLLTDVDFAALMRHHRESGAAVTVSTYRRAEQIQLGVLQLAESGDVTGYDEKPTLHLDVSMGAYVMSAAVLDRIPAGYYDMPQLILDLLADGQRVTTRRHDGFWLDIGRVDDYALANEMFAEDPGRFIPPSEFP
jgi:NDP-sugar pyrophosphorylase family protein